jgi:hypothetical protein
MIKGPVFAVQGRKIEDHFHGPTAFFLNILLRGDGTTVLPYICQNNQWRI